MFSNVLFFFFGTSYLSQTNNIGPVAKYCFCPTVESTPEVLKTELAIAIAQFLILHNGGIKKTNADILNLYNENECYRLVIKHYQKLLNYTITQIEKTNTTDDFESFITFIAMLVKQCDNIVQSRYSPTQFHLKNIVERCARQKTSSCDISILLELTCFFLLDLDINRDYRNVMKDLHGAVFDAKGFNFFQVVSSTNEIESILAKKELIDSAVEIIIDETYLLRLIFEYRHKMLYKTGSVCCRDLDDTDDSFNAYLFEKLPKLNTTNKTMYICCISFLSMQIKLQYYIKYDKDQVFYRKSSGYFNWKLAFLLKHIDNIFKISKHCQTKTTDQVDYLIMVRHNNCIF